MEEDEPEGPEMVFEAIPPKIRDKRFKKPWPKVLAPAKASPGSSARIDQHYVSRGSAQQIAYRIKRIMWEAAPYEKWEFHTRPLQDRSGFGIWVVYQGMMTYEEHAIETKRRAEASAFATRIAEKRRQNALLRPKTTTPTVKDVTRPTPRPW